MRGDVDGDGKITENDANQMSQHTTGGITLTGVDLWCADINGNGSVTNLDISIIRQYINGIATPLTKTPTFADYYNNWAYHKVDDLTGYWTAEITINGLKATSDAIVNIGNDEGIFYKSELSDGAIHFYATRPPIAEVAATITFKPGTGVITTSYESAKFHAATHSKDGADPITPESIGALSLSGGTMTGPLVLSDDPTKDLEAATKQYVDNHTSDVVLYTPQSLTDDQKTQARGNIGAIGSASFNRIGAVIGLCGWNQIIPTKTYANSVTDTKTYLDFTIQAYSGNTYIGALFNRYQSTPGKIVDIFTSKYDCNMITWKHSGAKTDISLVANAYNIPAQIKTGDKLLVSLDVLRVNTTVAGGLSTDNQMLINLTELFGAGNEPSSVDEFRAIFGTTYYPYYDYPTAITKNGIVEYLNPPMELGVEYRTTERYKGKPVYAKLVDCGKFPAPGSSKQIAHGISNCYPIRVTGQMINTNTVPWSEAYSIGADGTNIRLYAQTGFSDQSGTNTVALIHYTKTTD